MKKKIRKWRLNYIVEFEGKEDALLLRPIVNSLLGYLSLLRGIEYAMEPDLLLMSEHVSSSHTEMIGNVVDLLHFRSVSQSEISSRDFRLLMDLIFVGYKWGLLEGKPFEFYAMPQKDLVDYPFPDELK